MRDCTIWVSKGGNALHSHCTAVMAPETSNSAHLAIMQLRKTICCYKNVRTSVLYVSLGYGCALMVGMAENCNITMQSIFSSPEPKAHKVSL